MAAKITDTDSPGLRRRPSGSRDIFDFVALSRIYPAPPRPANNIFLNINERNVVSDTYAGSLLFARSHGVRFAIVSTTFSARDGVQTTTDDAQNHGRRRGAAVPVSQSPPPPPSLARDRSSAEVRTDIDDKTTATRSFTPRND
ncbi:hypothetical protein ACI65C_007348 [Semiaphis heraclei]